MTVIKLSLCIVKALPNMSIYCVTLHLLWNISDRRKVDKLNLEEDSGEWEVKTVTSALKNYFRSLPEPLMTYKLHEDLIAAASKCNKTSLECIQQVLRGPSFVICTSEEIGPKQHTFNGLG